MDEYFKEHSAVLFFDLYREDAQLDIKSLIPLRKSEICEYLKGYKGNWFISYEATKKTRGFKPHFHVLLDNETPADTQAFINDVVDKFDLKTTGKGGRIYYGHEKKKHLRSADGMVQYMLKQKLWYDTNIEINTEIIDELQKNSFEKKEIQEIVLEELQELCEKRSIPGKHFGAVYGVKIYSDYGQEDRDNVRVFAKDILKVYLKKDLTISQTSIKKTMLYCASKLEKYIQNQPEFILDILRI
ncbi:MAG: hypothetical protein [Circular genetic element sp.]|nr:MAG: hypothetical protein [Circular genetic element sp.]